MMKMNSVLSLITILAAVQIGYALKCWTCPLDQNPNKPCLKPDANPNTNASSFQVQECSGNDAACVKSITSAELLGKTFDLAMRMCMPGMKPLAGRCMDQEVPGPNGKKMRANMCICDTDQCNSAPFSTQLSMFGMLLPAIISAITFSF